MAIHTRNLWLSVVIAMIAVASFATKDASGAGVAYTYDTSGRVISALYDNGMCVSYSYDANGNRTSQTNATSGSPAWGTGTFGCFNWTP
jgi:YD repeat-containing protein